MDEKINHLAKLLQASGLKYAFGIPGSGDSLHLISSLEDFGVRYFPAAHEASAAIMAGSVYRVSGEVAASISIKGPGLTNMLPGIAYNFLEGNGIVSISEAYGSGVPRYRKHKRLGHSILLSSIVKEIAFLDRIEYELEALLLNAKREIPGPVHLELCSSGSSGDDTSMFKTSGDAEYTLKRQKLFRRIHKARQPVLVVGSLALRRSWGKRLSTLNIPVFTTASAKGVLDEGLPQSAGVFTGDGKVLAPESILFEEADLVVAIGLRNTEVLSPKPFAMPLVMIDEVDSGLAEGFGSEIVLIDSNPGVFEQIIKELQNKCWGMDRVALLLRKLREELLAVAWSPARCFEILNHSDFRHALVIDTGLFCTIGEHVWMASPKRFFIGSSNGRYMGASLPSAIGVGIAVAGLPVFCVAGDGGFRMYPSEIKLTVEEKLPVCFILMTDGRYSSIASAYQGGSVSQRAVNIYGPSWLGAIEGMGCESYQVNNEESFEDCVRKWKRTEPLFIEATFDPIVCSRLASLLR